MEDTSYKARTYAQWHPLCDDGSLWRAVWEVRTDREDKLNNGKQRTDQLIQIEGRLHLAALLVEFRRYDGMTPGDQYQDAWDGTFEICPDSLWVDHGYGDKPEITAAEEEEERRAKAAAGSGAMPDPQPAKGMKTQEIAMYHYDRNLAVRKNYITGRTVSTRSQAVLEFGI